MDSLFEVSVALGILPELDALFLNCHEWQFGVQKDMR